MKKLFLFLVLISFSNVSYSQDVLDQFFETLEYEDFYGRVVRACEYGKDVQCSNHHLEKEGDVIKATVNSGGILYAKGAPVAKVYFVAVLLKDGGYDDILVSVQLEPLDNDVDRGGRDLTIYRLYANMLIGPRKIAHEVFFKMGIMYKEIKAHNQLDCGSLTFYIY